MGSELIGQGFKSPAYFQPRPSAAGADGYDAANSVGLEPRARRRRSCATAWRPTSRGCGRRTRRRRPRCRPSSSRPPASGLDPHLSRRRRRWQVAARGRGARRRRRPTSRRCVDARIEARTFGFLGEPRVNVLLLNLDLDRALRPPGRRGAEPVDRRRTANELVLPGRGAAGRGAARHGARAAARASPPPRTSPSCSWRSPSWSRSSAAAGRRWPPRCASALSLDFFLTQPYLRLAIAGQARHDRLRRAGGVRPARGRARLARGVGRARRTGTGEGNLRPGP